MAIARRILKVIYYTLKNMTPYVERGAAYFNKMTEERQIQFHLNKLKKLGVNLEANAAP
jgi:hypothetical protein